VGGFCKGGNEPQIYFIISEQYEYSEAPFATADSSYDKQEQYLTKSLANIVKINCETPETYKKWSQNCKKKYISILTN
jgi:hypothetical protein